jgi:hypothetical protein
MEFFLSSNSDSQVVDLTRVERNPQAKKEKKTERAKNKNGEKKQGSTYISQSFLSFHIALVSIYCK